MNCWCRTVIIYIFIFTMSFTKCLFEMFLFVNCIPQNVPNFCCPIRKRDILFRDEPTFRIWLEVRRITPRANKRSLFIWHSIKKPFRTISYLLSKIIDYHEASQQKAIYSYLYNCYFWCLIFIGVYSIHRNEKSRIDNSTRNINITFTQHISDSLAPRQENKVKEKLETLD